MTPNDEIQNSEAPAADATVPDAAEVTQQPPADPALQLVTDDPPQIQQEPQPPAEDFKRKYDATHGRLKTTVRQHQEYEREVNQRFAEANTEMDTLRKQNELLQAQVTSNLPPEPPPAELIDELGERAATVMWNAMQQKQGNQPSPVTPATPAEPAPAPTSSSPRFKAPRAPQINERTINVQTHLDYTHPDWNKVVFGDAFKQWANNTVNPNTSQTFNQEFDRANRAYDAVGISGILDAYKAATNGARTPAPQHVLPVVPGGSYATPTPAMANGMPSPAELRKLYARAAKGGAQGQTAQDQINKIEAKMKAALTG